MVSGQYTKSVSSFHKYACSKCGERIRFFLSHSAEGDGVGAELAHEGAAYERFWQLTEHHVFC